jgi:hypothetical protein
VSVGSYYNAGAGTLKIAAAIPGDTTLDGQVAASDLNTVLKNLGQPITPGLNWQSGDFAYADQVDASDLNAVLQHLGGSLPAAVVGRGGVGGGVQFDAAVGVPQAGVAAVPEPGTLALLAAGLAVAGIAAVRRRAKIAG